MSKIRTKRTCELCYDEDEHPEYNIELENLYYENLNKYLSQKKELKCVNCVIKKILNYLKLLRDWVEDEQPDFWEYPFLIITEDEGITFSWMDHRIYFGIWFEITEPLSALVKIRMNDTGAKYRVIIENGLGIDIKIDLFDFLSIKSSYTETYKWVSKYEERLKEIKDSTNKI